MKIIRFNDLDVVNRDDGRTIRELCEQELGMDIREMKFIFVEHPPNFTEKPHFHKESFEMFFFMDDAEYMIEGRNYEIKKGDFVVFEPKDIHGGLPTPNKVGLFIIQAPPIEGDKHFPEEGI